MQQKLIYNLLYQNENWIVNMQLEEKKSAMEDIHCNDISEGKRILAWKCPKNLT